MTDMPPKLAEIVEEFRTAPREVVLEMLLEFSDAVPALPAHLQGHEGMEQVPECQTQFFLRADVRPDRTVRAWFDCPPEAPTTRAFAGILAEKGIPHELDVWGHDVPHDWPAWRAQLAHHLPRFC